MGGMLPPDLTGLLRPHAERRRRQLAAEDARTSQERQLLRLVRRAEGTRFGRDHGFAAIHDVRGFQERVPLRSYGQLWDAYWRDGFPTLDDVTWPGRIPFFAVSSGTSTGAVKHIPCSAAMVRSNRRAALDILVHHLAARPSSPILDGSFFVLGGSTDLKELAPGVRAGDISGIAAYVQPWWSRPFAFPPPEVRFLTDWEEKLERMATLSLRRRIRGLSGAPGWLLVLFDKLASLRPESEGLLARLYPQLELLIHGGAGFAPYRQRFERLMAGSAACLREVYPASEGFIAIADRAAGRRTAPDHRQRAVLRVRAGRGAGLARPHPALGRQCRARRRLRHRALHLRRALGLRDRRRRPPRRPEPAAPAHRRPDLLHAVGLRRARHRRTGRARPAGGRRRSGPGPRRVRGRDRVHARPGRLGPPRPCRRVRRPAARSGHARRVH